MIKNINVFKSSPIIIKINDSEQIKIDKVPALATLIMYEDEKFIDDLFGIETELKNIYNLQQENTKEDLTKNIIKCNSKIACFIKNYYKNVIEIIKTCIKKQEEWIEQNIGYLEMWHILLAIFYKNAEESSDVVKKNEV